MKIFPYTESKISDHLKDAEDKLELKGYQVVRHVKNGKVFRLEVWGWNFKHLLKVSLAVGDGYKLLLNPREQEILIQ